LLTWILFIFRGDSICGEEFCIIDGWFFKISGFTECWLNWPKGFKILTGYDEVGLMIGLSGCIKLLFRSTLKVWFNLSSLFNWWIWFGIILGFWISGCWGTETGSIWGVNILFWAGVFCKLLIDDNLRTKF
jgi:hypothetical protein